MSLPGKYYDIVVCGSGPAGLSATLAAVENGASVLLLERMDNFGRKLTASGNGRCNFSNISKREKFMEAFGKNGRFMNDALEFAPREWLCDFLASKGVPSILEGGFHYFPASGKASDILNAFLNTAISKGADVFTSSEVKEIKLSAGKLESIIAGDDKIMCKALVLACGGTAMPHLGGTYSGLKLAKNIGHKIITPLPAMSPLYICESCFKSLSGVSLPNARLSFSAGRKSASQEGELLFTHDGFSGPVAINISADVAENFTAKGKLTLNLCFDASKDISAWMNIINEKRVSEPKKLFRTVLGQYFPHSLAEKICMELNLADKKISELSRRECEISAKFLNAAELHTERIAPMEKAMAMKGGVSLKEVNPKTMESRIVEGIFFAGEILDLTGPCGGYNIQFAFSSGRLAGNSATLKSH